MLVVFILIVISYASASPCAELTLTKSKLEVKGGAIATIPINRLEARIAFMCKKGLRNTLSNDCYARYALAYECVDASAVVNESAAALSGLHVGWLLVGAVAGLAAA